MAIKKIRMRPEGTNDYGDILHPETSADVVKFADGSTVEAHKADIVHVPFAIASGTNSYAVNISDIKTLVEGMSVKIKFASANTGACTLNINGLGAKTIAKSNGSVLSSGNIKANQIVHLAYNGTSFQLLGEGGEYGTAQASDVLAPKTVGTESGIITGTMVNRGAPAQTLTTQGGQYNIPPGYFSGGSVKAQFANLMPGNIRDGVVVGGQRGTFTGAESYPIYTCRVTATTNQYAPLTKYKLDFSKLSPSLSNMYPAFVAMAQGVSAGVVANKEKHESYYRSNDNINIVEAGMGYLIFQTTQLSGGISTTISFSKNANDRCATINPTTGMPIEPYNIGSVSRLN